MRQKRKKLIRGWAAALLALTLLLPAKALAIEYNYYYLGYSTNTDGISVSVSDFGIRNSSKFDGIVNIPETVTIDNKTYSVTSIAGEVFYYENKITSVTIPNTVTTIGSKAFQGCTGLTSITIPNSVTKLGWRAFYGCNGLRSITLGNGITEFCVSNSSLPPDTFTPTESGLPSITVNWNVTGVNLINNIDNLSFVSGSRLIQRQISKLIVGPDVVNLTGYLTWKEYIEEINWNAKKCTSNSLNLQNVKTVRIGSDVQKLPFACFSSCSNLSVVRWEAKNCGDFTALSCPFYGLSNVTMFNFVNQVEHIPSYLCSGLSGIQSISIPNSVTSIGKFAFNGCEGLTSVTIPDLVAVMGESAFSGCIGLTNVNWNAINCNDFTSTTKPFSGLANLNNFSFGNNVTKVPAYICSELTGLNNVGLGSNIQTIGNNAFSGCSGLSSINLPNKVTTIGTESFKGISLTSLVIPTSITTINSSAFSDCSQLREMTIEGRVSTIQSRAYANTSSLNNIKCFSTAPPQAIDTTVFAGIIPSNVTLEVPLAAVDAYTEHDVWKQFYIKPASGSTQGTGGFPGSGSGTEADPYLIFNPIQLYSVRNFTGYDGVVFKLMQDVDVSEFLAENNPTQGWEPIGVQESPFKGIFYGENHKITGMSMNRSSNYNGLFGYIDGALINNLTIEGSTMTGGNYSGAVVGVAQSSYLTNITANVNVSGKSYTGGFVGVSLQTTLTNCHHTGTVTATDSISGGFAGNLKGSLTTGSHHGSVTGKQQTGGFAGVAAGTIRDIVCEGSVTGTQYTGGFAGKNAANTSNVTVQGNVSGTNYTGGFAGYNTSDVNTASHNGTVKGTTYTGGFAGWTESSEIEDYSHDGNITSISGNFVGGFAGSTQNSTMRTNMVKGSITTNNATYVGGFAGYASNCIVNDFQAQTGSLSGNTKVGGFVGEARTITATSCYTVGDITAAASSLVGGFIAYNYGSLSLSQCGTVSNVTVNQTSATSRVGGLVGHLTGTTNNNTISNCFAVGDIKTGGDRVGGIVGDATQPVTITNSYYSGNITGSSYLGGIVGYGGAVTMSNNYANGSINGYSTIGGIAGYLTNSSRIESSVAAQDNINAVNGIIGRVYGLLEGGSSVGTQGTNYANRGMTTMSVVDAGQQIMVEDGEQHGTSLGKGLLKYKSSYQGIGWDFSTDWTILETESFPYKPSQCAPPVITSTLTAGGITISGKCAAGTNVHVIIGANTYEATVSGTSWTATVPAMQSGAIVKVYTTSSSEIQSYFVTAKVGYLGDGTEDTPYLIYTAEDLANINSYSYYKVMNDIDLTEWINTNSSVSGWLPIGMSGGGTMRQLDGNGHTITGLWINNTVDNTGLISSIENATIKNLTVVVASGKKVASNNNYVGIVVGKSVGSTFDKVTVQGEVQGANYIASIAGYAQNGTFSNCIVNGGSITSTGAYVGGVTGYATDASFNICEVKEITATSTGNYLAGIAAYTQNATFTECKVDNASISTSNGGHVGGIAGYSDNDNFAGCSVEESSLVGTGNYAGGIAAGSLTNCTFDSCMVKNTTIGGASYVGGLTGQIANSLSDLKLKGIIITATGDYIGGLVGKTTASIDNCSVDADITGGDYLGGITGHSNNLITLCEVTGKITTTKLINCRAGGIVGYMTGNIANCYSTARTVGGQYAGGIAGYSFGKINNCYSSGDLYSTYFAGGIVGYLDGANAAVNNCFAINNKIDVSDQNGIAMRVIGGFKNDAPTPQSNNYALKTMVVSVNNVTQIIYDDVLEGISLTADALMQQSTYAAQGWDFDETWGIDEGEGYPFLLALVEAETPDVLPGDVNGDGTVNVTDYVAVARYILEQNPQPFILAAADLDGNETVNVTDLVRVAILALNFEGNAPRRAPAAVVGDIAMDAALCENELTIDLNSDIDITALQMDIALPAGVSVTEAVLTDRASASHTVDVAQLTTGDYRLLAASSLCKAFKGHEGAVLRIKLSGEPQASVTLHSIQLASTAADGFEHDDIVLAPVVTALNDLSGQTRVYGENGQVIVEAPVAGNVVIALPNGMNITRAVKAGRNVISVPARGIVIVKAGYKATKLIL